MRWPWFVFSVVLGCTKQEPAQPKEQPKEAKEAESDVSSKPADVEPEPVHRKPSAPDRLLRQAIETSQQRDVGTVATWARLSLAAALERQGEASEEIDELRSAALQGCATVPPTQQDDCRRKAGG